MGPHVGWLYNFRGPFQWRSHLPLFNSFRKTHKASKLESLANVMNQVGMAHAEANSKCDVEWQTC